MICGLGQKFILLLSFFNLVLQFFLQKSNCKGFLMALLHLKATDIETYCKTIKQVNCIVVNLNSM